MKQTFALILLLFALACTDKKLAEVERMTDEVIAIHDEMMPLMDDLYRTRMNLQKAAEADSTSQEMMTKAIGQLAEAEDAMMVWMRNFNPTFRGNTHEETMAYLQDQKRTMQAVAKQMKKALKEGKSKLPDEK